MSGVTLTNANFSGFGAYRFYVGAGDASNADFSYAGASEFSLGGDLLNANLSFLRAQELDLGGSRLIGADLSYARANFVFWANGSDFSGANLTGFFAGDEVFLDGANFSGAILANMVGLQGSIGIAFYDAETDFSGTNFDPVAAGWTLIPEPSTALLMGLGLVWLRAARRQP
jgi:uncharacterized protein YjbI with pentapeptide repeats